MNTANRLDKVDDHIRTFFSDHRISEQRWTLGPVPELMPDFRVLCVAPGSRTGCWTYLSVGASAIEHERHGLAEFFIISPVEDERILELVTMTAWYHKNQPLGLGHTFPIGEPWRGESQCNHMLVSTPYPFGPKLEICEPSDGQIQFFWLLPITEAERDYKVANDLERLEQAFDDAQIEYWNESRTSVV